MKQARLISTMFVNISSLSFIGESSSLNSLALGAQWRIVPVFKFYGSLASEQRKPRELTGPAGGAPLPHPHLNSPRPSASGKRDCAESPLPARVAGAVCRRGPGVERAFSRYGRTHAP